MSTQLETTTTTTTTTNNNKFQFCIDRGGTFTDVHCILPNGKHVVSKLLSEDPLHYPDAPTEGIRRLLDEYGSAKGMYPRGITINTSEIASIRMGTTVATNALLERRGSPLALVITRGFKDLLEIGNQARPNIFDLSCAKPSLLYQRVLEVDERVALNHYFPKSSSSSSESSPTSTGSSNNDDDDDDASSEEHAAAEATAATLLDDNSEVIVKGLTGEDVRILTKPNLNDVRHDLQKLRDDGIQALAICCMHSYTYPDHELMIGEIAREIGFEQISLSSQVMPMVKLVSR